MSFQAVIHLPKEQKDTEKLMQEIARFRAEKTLKILREQGVTPKQLKGILDEIQRKRNGSGDGGYPSSPPNFRDKIR